MKIGITCYPTFGGSGVVATELGIALAERGDEVHFISYALPSRLELPRERVHFHEVVAPSYPLFVSPPYTLALATKMAEVARHAHLDLLHVHYALPHAVSAILAREMGNGNGVRLKVVTTLHGTDVTIVGQDRSYLPITRWSIDQSDAVTAVSQYLKDVTVREFGVQREIEVVPNFVDTRLYRPGGLVGLRADARPAGRSPARARVQLPAGQAGSRRARDLRARAAPDAGAPAPDRGRSGPLARRAPGPGGGIRGPDDVSRQRRGDRDDPSRRAPHAPALRTRSRSASRPSRRWPAACRSSARPPEDCPRSSRTASRGFCGRSATSRAWPPARSGSSRTRRVWQTFSAAARRRAENDFPTDGLVSRYRALYEKTLTG